MPTYALLGATGSTGSSILRCLLSQPPKDLTLNVFVRSRSNLCKAFPEIEDITTLKINIIEGISSNAAAMQECLKDVDVVMACIASNYSTRNMTLVNETTVAIIEALKVHRGKRDFAYKSPTIIQLRAGLVNPVYRAATPWFPRQVVCFCFRYVYEDLKRACELLSSAATNLPGLFNYIIIDPPSMHDSNGSIQTGHKLILDEHLSPALSYADLGAAFCEVAERRDDFVWKAVGVKATGPVHQTWGRLMGYMVAGAKGRLWG